MRWDEIEKKELTEELPTASIKGPNPSSGPIVATPFKEVKAWIMSQFTDNPLPRPKPRKY